MGDLTLFGPELAVLGVAAVAFVLTVVAPGYRTTWLLTTFGAGLAVVVTALMLNAHGEPFYPGMYRVDVFSQLLKLGLTLGLLLTLLISRDLSSVRESARTEVPFFLTLSTLGMMLLVSATELLTLFVALELSAYGLYILAALHIRQHVGSEAAAKYVLFGAASSAITLFGISLLFGVTGTTYLADVMMVRPTPVLVLGVVLTLAGVFFKMAALPFHAWAPDTYQGAPHQIATFIGTTSKVAAAGLLVRVLSLVDAEAIMVLLMVLSVASMTIGNLAALAQRDLKRLLGWSTVAQAGYILLAVITLSEAGMAAAIFYGMIYLLVAFAAFMVVSEIGGDENPTLESLSGLYRRAPILAMLLLVGMFGLAGIPPTPGFAGKWFIFSAAMQGGYFWLVFIGAVNATVSLYYYLRVVRFAYLHPPEGRAEITVSAPSRAAAWIAMALVAFTGFVPGPLWDLASGAARAVLGG